MPEPASPGTPLRIWLVGFGHGGQVGARALDSHAQRPAREYGVRVIAVGLANARDGFIYDERGLDLSSVLRLAAGGAALTDEPGVCSWPSALDGLRATEADLLVEVTSSPSGNGEPGVAHMREALERRIPVVTSNRR